MELYRIYDQKSTVEWFTISGKTFLNRHQTCIIYYNSMGQRVQETIVDRNQDGSLGRPNCNRCPELLGQDMREDIETQKDSPTPEKQRENRIEKQQSFICERIALAPV